MRHLLFPGRCQPLPPPPSRWARLRARLARHWGGLQAFVLEVGAGAGDLEPAALAALGLALTWPTPAPVPGQPVGAWIQIVVQIVIMIVAAVVAASMAPKPPVPKPAALSDLDVPQAEEGKPIPKVFGTCWVRDPNVLWYGDLATTPIKQKTGK